MLRKADLISHLDRRLNSTLQDAVQRTEALKRRSPQPIIPIDPKINQSGAGAELGRGAFREWISCDHQGKRKEKQELSRTFSNSGEVTKIMCLVYPWSAQCFQTEDAIEEDEDDLFRNFWYFGCHQGVQKQN